MKYQPKKYPKGFTLIELLVVVLIIGILSAVAVSQYQKAVEKARFTEYITWGRAIYQATQEYALANNEEWGGDFSALTLDFPAGSKITVNKVTFPDDKYFLYNKNNNGVQSSYNGVLLVLYLKTGKFTCYHYNDSTKKAVCEKVSSSCEINVCDIITF